MAAKGGQQVTVGDHTLTVTNLDKVLYPATGTTKGEVIAYYAEVGKVLVPHVRQRPMTRKRWPDGVGTDGGHVNVFFAKDLPRGTPGWVRRYPIEHSEGTNNYPVANDIATLVWLAQLAALELHVPQWRFAEDGTPLHPDRLVLDLDPGEGVTLAECAEVAGWVREVLDGAGMASFPVTSGSKGIHLYAHLDGSLDPGGASALARELAEALQAEHPDRVTAVMRRADRPGKVFLDWSQNNGNKTTITPYSLRGRTHPTVAAPRTWAELADPDLRHLEFHEVLARLADQGDLMAPLVDPEPLADPEPLVELVETPSAITDSADKLRKYRSMRDPAKTPEPVPAHPPEASDGRSFVIQEHHARRLHYDFRLERDGVLVSWAVPKGPPTDPKKNHLAVPTEDHPLEYGSFEGTIPKGEYGGGSVRIWDAGTYDLEKWRDKEVIVVLHGRPDGGLGGQPAKFALIRTGEDWLMHRMAIPGEQTPEQPTPGPVPEERERVTKGPPPTPADFEPMLATLASPADLGDEADWAFEMKWDGVRVLVQLDHGSVQLRSRRGRDESARYPDVLDDLADLPCEQAVLDGEIVALDDAGAPSFEKLQPRMNLTRPADIAAAAVAAPAQVMLFDLLSLNGQSLLQQPYEVRRELLESLARPEDPSSGSGTASSDPATVSRVHVPAVFDGDLAAALDTSEAFRLEGVVAKRRGSGYEPGRRSSAWLKIKHRRTQAVVVGGWRLGRGNRAGTFGSLLVGVPGPDGLAYAGRVGSGFADAGLAEAMRQLTPLARATSPFLDVPHEDARDASWVEPQLVGEVFYAERTGSNRLRAPVWRGWRPDLTPADVVWE